MATAQIFWQILSPNNEEEGSLKDVKLIFFFSDSHLAPKVFKVVANSKKVGHHFLKQTKRFLTLFAH